MPMKTIDAATAKQWLAKGEAIMIDVREPAEHAAENIAGATLIPLATVSKQMLPDAQGKKIIVHCRSGMRSANACAKLLVEDPTLDLYNLEGGIIAWAKMGSAVAKSGKCCLPLGQQVQLTIGLGVLTGSLLTYFIHPLFMLMTGFFGAGLIFAGISGTCALATIIAKMPWNQCRGKETPTCIR
jgi:rhodanese-related sulfurtransferase